MVQKRGFPHNDKIDDYAFFLRQMIVFEKCCLVYQDGYHGIAFGAVHKGDLVVAIDGLDHGVLNRLILRPVDGNISKQPHAINCRLVGKAILPRLVVEPPKGVKDRWLEVA